MKKITYSQIGSRLESAGIVEPEVIHNALTTARTIGRPMISLLMRNVQRYNDEEMETDAKRAISEILEIPFFTNPGDCTVDQSLTKLIGLNKIEKQMAFVVISNGRRYLHTLDPMDAEIVAPAMNALKGYDVSDCCMASPACISSLMTREIMPMLAADAIHSELAELLRVEGVNARGFGIIPKLLVLDTRLTAEAKAIYALIATYAGGGNTEFPSVQKLCADLGISRNTYYKHYRLLVEYGYITATQPHYPDAAEGEKAYSRNIYTLSNSPSLPDELMDDAGIQKSGKTMNGVLSAGYGFIPKLVMLDSELCIKAKALYAFLCAYAGSGCVAFPTKRAILYRLQISKPTYLTAMRELETRDYVLREQRIERCRGGMGPNNFTLNTNPDINNPKKKAQGKAEQASKMPNAKDPQLGKNRDTPTTQMGQKFGTPTSQMGKNFGIPNSLPPKNEEMASQQGLRDLDGSIIEKPSSDGSNLDGSNFRGSNFRGSKNWYTRSNNIGSNNILKYQSINSARARAREVTDVNENNLAFALSDAEAESVVAEALMAEGVIPDEFFFNDTLRTMAVRLITQYDVKSRKYWWTTTRGADGEFAHSCYMLFVEALTEMSAPQAKFYYAGAGAKVLVTGEKVCRKINDYLRTSSEEGDMSLPELDDAVQTTAMDNYMTVATNMEIKNPMAYMKSCIWTALQVGDVGLHSDLARYFAGN